MDERLLRNAEEVRASITQGTTDPLQFRAALTNVSPLDRDAWIDAVLGLNEVLDDGPELPKGCVPYLPCAVDGLRRIAELMPVRATDVFVDIGSGVGRAAAVMHLLTGASAMGIEVQSGHVHAARDMVKRLRLSNVTFVQRDAALLGPELATGTVFFLYCPFSGERLEQFLANLEGLAQTRPISICAVDLPLPACSWLERREQPHLFNVGDVVMYRSRRRD